MNFISKLTYFLVITTFIMPNFAGAKLSQSADKVATNNQTFEDDFGDTEVENTTPEEDIWDPLETLNRHSFRATMWLDDKIIAPIDSYYLTTVPHPIRTGVVNAYLNLLEPSNIVNNGLQLKVISASIGIFRFFINTTLGFFGTIDVASSLGIKQRLNDLGYTLQYYHVGRGPYLFIPILGPYFLRGGVGALTTSMLYMQYSHGFGLAINTGKMLYYLEERPSLISMMNSGSDNYSMLKYAFYQHRKLTFEQLKNTW